MAASGPDFREDGSSVHEEVNRIIASLPDDERAKWIADREFQETMTCEPIEGWFVQMTGNPSDEDKAQMAGYLRFLKERRAAEAAGQPELPLD